MKGLRIFAWVFAVLVGSMFVIGANYYFSLAGNSVPWTPPPSISSVVNDVVGARTAALDADPTIDFGSEDEVNILILGLDSRKGSDTPHCDAIHMFTLNLKDWTIQITSVPRGTYSYIPPGTYPSTEYYLANACAYAGMDYGINQIEKIVGVKADYYVTAGFSQVLGILRTFDLPTTETLQWLRHRQSYAIGDPQRSHNQAVFMKDMILTQLDRFRGDFSVAVMYILYNFTDTDMDFGTARAILEGYMDAKIDERPDDITLRMRPYHETVDYHLDIENADQQVSELLERLEGRLSREDLSGRSIESIQTELVEYLTDSLDSEEDFQTIIDQQLWRQVENDDLRLELHFSYIEQLAMMELDKGNEDRAVQILSDYVIEMEAFEEDIWANRAKDLISTIVTE